MSWRNPPLRCHRRVPRRCDRSLWMQVLFLRVVALALVVGIPAPGVCAAQQSAQWYGGGLIGVSTLSADAQTVTSSVGFSVALYKPENGLATNWFVGTHLTDHVTLQANYIWKRTDRSLNTGNGRGDRPFRTTPGQYPARRRGGLLAVLSVEG